jgi:hypothetical protein
VVNNAGIIQVGPCPRQPWRILRTPWM